MNEFLETFLAQLTLIFFGGAFLLLAYTFWYVTIPLVVFLVGLFWWGTRDVKLTKLGGDKEL